MQPYAIYVIYDGVDNPVFESQVLKPILDTLTQNSEQLACLISFEKTASRTKKIEHLRTLHERLRIIILKKYPFLSTWSLFLASKSLRKLLKSYTQYKLQARGPFAGYICLKAVSWHQCTTLTVQARGLVAAEYEYTHQLHKLYGPSTWLHRLRLLLFKRLEKKVYSLAPHIPCTVEAVSTALRDYLITTFGLDPKRCSLAQDDIPALIHEDQRIAWRYTTREHLQIPLQAHVYCYNGSAKPWQCPRETIIFFKERYCENTNNFLLILTQDINVFEKLLADLTIPKTAYRILHIAHHEIYRYLAACDTGIIFREPHLMNWISRPTKALEYQAAGLTIIHNETIAHLKKIQSSNKGGFRAQKHTLLS